ncbi:transcriptional regulator PpsR [Paucibacter sp. M5-1]|uniref:transcriptional regulator PpsR n=1 Tax=Paucibacter sp. M5-1 TaxID=3015998 RepID=UPI0022B8E96A|nr:transcriptional regulator PpsR [Paucibacter sp. M5-1]MCZ7884996.1 transcriptional regulator PpsR [Paucibacter sp. M5-1]
MSTASEDPSDLSALSPLASELANTIARVASDIALVIDKDGVISAVAEGQAVQAQGCGDWVGQRWVDTVTASTRGKIQSLLDEVTNEGVVSRRREVSHPAQGGQELPLTWAAIRLGADGPVLAVGRDLRAVAAIQQRFVEAQQDMERHFWSRRQAESRYQLLFQVANDAVLVLDALSLKVLEANAASAALLGHDAGSIQGRSLSESLPPSARAAVLELLATARSSGRAGEIRVRGPAGALDVSATPFRADEAQLILVRARREDAASADSLALARMAEFVETTPDAVVITDSAGAVLMANPAFLRLAHQANELALRGRALSELLLDADGGWAQMIERVRSTGIVSSASLEVGSPSGDPQTVQVTAALMTEGEQACLGFILRPGGPAMPLQMAGDDVLAGLLDQVGQVPLADLLVEVAHRAERQLIASALLRSGGRRDAAAEALGMTSEALGLRMQRHGLSGLGYLPGNGGSTHLIN